MGFASTLALAGCAGPRPPRPGELPGAGARAYRALHESLAIDSAPLAGRTIVIDPGHGGGYRGARGPRGLAEADVNLAVGLFLWGLLHEAGARVALTRTADRDFVGGALAGPEIIPLSGEPPPGPTVPGLPTYPDSLPADLAARIERANQLAPDLFLSIHHNADASGDTTRNQTQTFYRMGDAGPSLDAAEAIHRHLMLNLGTQSGRVLPGNYHVLRRSTAAAAVLGEASFLTNPLFEDRLLRIDRVELEATAYFLGILDYFRGGVARVLALEPADTTLDATAIEVRGRLGGSPVDPASIRLLLDGTPLAGVRIRSGAVLAAGPTAPLANGPHRLELRARCLGGNAVPAGHAGFRIARPAAALELRPHPLWDGGAAPGPLALEVRVRDGCGLPVADGTPVRLREPRMAAAPTASGRAWFFLEPPGSELAGRRWRVEVDGASGELPLVAAGPAPPACSGWVRDASGRGIPGAALWTPAGAPLGRSAAAGFFAVGAPAPAPAARTGAAPPCTVCASAPGYFESCWTAGDGARAGAGSGGGPLLEPRRGGILHGRRLAIDAAGGGAEALFLGSSGLRGAQLTLALAKLVAEQLASAGALPLLVREDERTLPALARVERAEAFGAERYLRINLTSGGADRVVRHYPGSRHGAALAAAVADAVAEVELLTASGGGGIGGETTTGGAAAGNAGRAPASTAARPPAVRARVTPILLHTSCPAVELLLQADRLESPWERLGDPAGRHQLARALVLALATELGYDPARSARLEVATTHPILVDGAWTVFPIGGVAVLAGLEPRPVTHKLTFLGLAPGTAAAVAERRLELAAGELRRLAGP